MAPPVAGYIAWYDASQITGLADGASLVTWPDLSGNGHNQIGQGSLPIYHSTAPTKLVNGKPAVWFDGSGTQWTKCAAFANPAPPYTWVAVVSGLSNASTSPIMLYTPAGGGVYMFAQSSPARWGLSALNFPGCAGGTPNASTHSLIAINTHAAANGQFLVDGTVVSTADPGGGGGGTADFSLGAWDDGTSGYAGAICEVLLYPFALSPAQITSLQSYLNGKWFPPINFVSAGTGNVEGAATITINAPSAITAGNELLMFVVGTAASAPPWTAPAGWTSVGFNAAAGYPAQLWKKTATGSEPSSYTVSGLGAGAFASGMVAQYSGATGLDGAGGVLGGSNSPYTLASLTPSGTNRLWVAFGGFHPATAASPPAGFTQEALYNTGGDGRIYLFDQYWPTNTPTGTASGTFSGGGTNWVGIGGLLLQTPAIVSGTATFALGPLALTAASADDGSSTVNLGPLTTAVATGVYGGSSVITLGPFALASMGIVSGNIIPPPTPGYSPPYPLTASYPKSIKSFLTYQDQPGNANHIVPDPNNPSGAPVDLTYDKAFITDEIHVEILAIEQTIGVGQYITKPSIPGKLGNQIQWLLANKAPGHADPYTGNVPPAPPPSHNHEHQQTGNLTHDDHTRYVLANGKRGFTAPVTAPSARSSNQLVNLGQVRGKGYLTATQVQSIIASDLARTSDYPMTGPTARRWRMTGGMAQGYTNADGNLWVSMAAAQFSVIRSFVYMKMPFPGGSMLGWYAYQYEEDQLTLLSLDPSGAWIQFKEDIVVDKQALVCMSWLALGY